MPFPYAIHLYVGFTVVDDDSICKLSDETGSGNCTQRKIENTAISFLFWVMHVDVLGEGIVKNVVDIPSLVSHVDALVAIVSSLTIILGHDLVRFVQSTGASWGCCLLYPASEESPGSFLCQW